MDLMNARVDAAINLHLREPPRAWIPEDEPLICSTTMLEFEGACFLPEERKGDRFQVTIYAETRTPEKVGDYRELDARGMPVSRKRGDAKVPVYRRPLGIATLEKAHGERRWTTCAFLPPATVDAMRQLMYATRPLYLAVHERKTDRKRWAQSIGLQTRIPE